MTGAPVSFAGFQNQSRMPAWYGLADVLALTSESETWGLVANEAMSCGVPVVVSDRAGCADDLVDEALTGRRFRCGDRTLSPHPKTIKRWWKFTLFRESGRWPPTTNPWGGLS